MARPACLLPNGAWHCLLAGAWTVACAIAAADEPAPSSASAMEQPQVHVELFIPPRNLGVWWLTDASGLAKLADLASSSALTHHEVTSFASARFASDWAQSSPLTYEPLRGNLLRLQAMLPELDPAQQVLMRQLLHIALWNFRQTHPAVPAIVYQDLVFAP